MGDNLTKEKTDEEILKENFSFYKGGTYLVTWEVAKALRKKDKQINDDIKVKGRLFEEARQLKAENKELKKLEKKISKEQSEKGEWRAECFKLRREVEKKKLKELKKRLEK